jgi:pimeloyl-ACP methyl ester carboxylesterase
MRSIMLDQVTIDGRFTVRVQRQGSGDPLLFLHGFEGHPGDAPFLQRLAQRHEVIAPELPGYAGSMDGSEQLQEIIDYALYYRRFIEEQVGRPVDLVGHDLGGMLAAEVAIISPYLVRRLALIDAYGLWLEENEIPDVFVQTPQALAELLWANPEGEAASQAAAAPEAAGGEVDPAAQALNAHQNRAIAARFLWAVPDRGLAKRLPYLQTPTLLIWGERDRLIPPAYARAFESRIRNARVEIIPDAGHLPMLEQPQAFDAAVEAFLQS